MTTGAIITMTIVFSCVAGLMIYFLSKVIRNENSKKE